MQLTQSDERLINVATIAPLGQGPLLSLTLVLLCYLQRQLRGGAHMTQFAMCAMRYKD